jgi:hypothetical protein
MQLRCNKLIQERCIIWNMLLIWNKTPVKKTKCDNIGMNRLIYFWVKITWNPAAILQFSLVLRCLRSTLWFSTKKKLNVNSGSMQNARGQKITCVYIISLYDMNRKRHNAFHSLKHNWIPQSEQRLLFKMVFHIRYYSVPWTKFVSQINMF